MHLYENSALIENSNVSITIKLKKIFCHILILVSFTSCFSQSKNNTGTIVLDVSVKSFGKTKVLPEEFYKTTTLNKEDITSAFYVTINNTLNVVAIPVNDKVFNYDYFYKNIYTADMNEKKVKLTVQQFIINDKKIYIAYEIAKWEK